MDKNTSSVPDNLKTASRYAVILCGGSGTRLWPLSRSLKPKQLLTLDGDLTLLQQTADRICQKISPSHLFTVTHESHKFDVKGQLAEDYPEALPNVIGEPVAQNTLPAIAIAVKRIHAVDPNALIGVFASDHAIDNEVAFFAAWTSAEKAAEAGYLALLGIQPDAPVTGYGYIQPGGNLGLGSAEYPVMAVETFVEKPSLEKAKQYLEAGYLWNGGMFVFRADVFMQLLATYQPQMSAQILAIADQPTLADYQKLESLSIDYGIAEKAEKVAVVPVDMRWSDLGSWESIYQRHPKGDNHNAIRGQVVLEDTKNSLIWAETGVVSVLGVENLVVVRTADVTMICDRNRAEDVKLLVNQIQERFPAMTETHLTVQRPWGSYTILEEGVGFKIKSITVNSHAKLSLQLHKNRSEHWVVVSGTATVTCGEKVYDVQTNQSTYISAGNKHRLENHLDQPLVIIEVQTGVRLDESDIIRFDDAYGRA